MDVKAILPLFSRLPRPVLVLLALAGAGYAAKAEVTWRGEVNHGIKKAATVEQLAELKAELRGLREDQLRFYRNWAEDRGYRDDVREYDKKLRELREKR